MTDVSIKSPLWWHNGWGGFFGWKNATPFAGASRGRFGGYALARLSVSVPGRGTPLSL